MMHEYHNALPGYDEGQILHDGCKECEHRGENVMRALDHMDTGTFRRAWDRARAWNAGDGSGAGLKISHAEAEVLRVLWAVQVHLERAV